MLALLAIVAAGFFAGAAVYITFVEHPARTEAGTAAALAQFAPSYRRATRLQASLAVAGCAAALGAWLGGAGLAFLLGGLLLGAVVPFTLVVIYPVNERLLDPALAPDSFEAVELLARWGWLHTVRSVLGTLAFLIELIAFRA